MPEPRTPLTCPHRESLRDDGGCVVRCRLVCELSDSPSASEGCVSDEVCRVCCQTRGPTAEAPNEVVASLAHGVVSGRLDSACSATDVMRDHERLIWLESFLGTAERQEQATSLKKVNRKAACPRGGWGALIGYGRPRIGLLGRNNLKGLGHQNRDLARCLPVDEWLVLEREQDAVELPRFCRYRTTYLGDAEDSWSLMKEWLRRIDVLLFVENPVVPGLTAIARERGLRIVCVPNWEWLHPGLRWLRDVDLMLCPTRFTQRILEDWKQRFGFQWDVRCQPWPFDVRIFRFRERQTCRRFVFVNGTDHRLPSRPDGQLATARRKGVEVLIDAARRVPNIPIVLWSQAEKFPTLPANIELRLSAASNQMLYEGADICVQPSRWEGLGLPLLECQAAGLPLITTDAPPMTEHNPLDVIRVTGEEPINLWHRRVIAAPTLCAEQLASVLDHWHGRDIRDASRAARAFVEREHAWHRVRKQLRRVIVGAPEAIHE